MRILSCIMFLMFCVAVIFPQSPHGDKLKIDCSNCHESESWRVIPKRIKFNHNEETSFKLIGQHESVSCESCHKSLIFSDAKSNCNSCHKDVHQNTLGPNCERCHSPDTWVVSNINQIHQSSRFPLMGVHLNVDCATCHSGYSNLYFPPQSVSCFSCHSKQYYATTSPNHVSAGFSTDCQDCHSLTSVTWSAENFNHSFFPLVGGHNIPNCYACHTQGSNFKGLNTSCYSCHSATFASATNPNHIAQNFPHDCSQCHSTNNWTDATFDHNKTVFPLTGAHVSVACASCHTTGFTSTPTDCYSCHSNSFTTASSPNHVSAGLPTTCKDCHNTSAWIPSSFNHASTGFALTGSHASLDCSSCHKGTVKGAATDCYSCHSATFASTTNPNHVTQGFPHDCSQCHSTINWSGASFDHSTTGFVLTGGHINVQCSQCHATGYTSTSPACYSCHQANYQSTTNPSHTALALSTDCSSCHTTNPGWTNATFPVHNNFYQIAGAHTTLACSQCHTGNYNAAPTTCYGCHQSNYNSTTNPPHQSAGYPTDCTQCHTQTAWSPSTFNHDTYFPISSGKHSGILCAQCHTTVSNFAVFSCTNGCHDQSSTDSKHQNVSGYVYSSPSCYSCHPTGQAGD
ncbi:MAG: hypothetical protein ACYCVH_04060 [Ignavibacteriaceae bacterium]